ADFGIVHDNRVHSDQAITPDVRAMDNRSVTDMRAFFQHDIFPRKHVDRAILLHVASVFDDDSAPIAANRRSRTDIDVLTDNHISGNGRLRMDKVTFVDDGDETLEFVYHFLRAKKKDRCTERRKTFFTGLSALAFLLLTATRSFLYLIFSNVLFVNSDSTSLPLSDARCESNSSQSSVPFQKIFLISSIASGLYVQRCFAN